MSHIIIDAKFEELVERLESVGEPFLSGRSAVIVVERGGYQLPLMFVCSKRGVVVKVGNGSQHVDQSLIQEVIAEFASRLSFPVKEARLAKKVLRRYGIPYP
ncbi:MAG: hypothetical protein GXO44_05795 [Deferribacteres bacterium]|nr:hypothetical protein [Deferribacteres bacterium]